MRRLPLSAPLLALLLAATACSGEEAPEETAEQAEESAAAVEPVDPDAETHVRRAAQGFLASLMAADGEAGCALMDEAARTVVADEHGAEGCPAAFPLYAESLRGGEGIEVGEVTMDTDLEGEVPIATVALVYPGEDHGPLEMRRDSDDQWVATRLPATSPGGA
ncbi:hypothetical protein [Nocardiopsis sp. HUAS JQ3]|uniref:hypothetical protein n=1 Tax=Nocardiopsis sp. HUAS JQ3 TaxID=3061629 RepID=UPI0023A9911F|nr:hypothetical protein [Nocardiopsis sp. HUAS JQ3]WDZ89432.1 hypothetical protein PV789_21175 [Nocardiopsis sp. HUAS JQ3]